MKKQQPLMIIAGMFVVLALGYFIYDRMRPRCDTFIEQTATRLSAKLHFIQSANSEMMIGREKVQELTDSSQKVALHLKACCQGQQSGSFSADQYQMCVNGAKDYENTVIQVTNIIRDAQTAREQGNTQLSDQRVAQAIEKVSAASLTASDLGKLVGNVAPLGPAPVTPVKVTKTEQEPNNTILQANLAEMGTTIAAAIAPQNDVDYFKFEYRDPKKRRDMVTVHLQNQSETLQPSIILFGQDKSVLRDWQAPNAQGADLEFWFSADPGKDYFVGVGSHNGSTSGRYLLSVTPQKAYDDYEPNDDAFTATPMKIGQTLEANIMDGPDVDWYRLSGVKSKTVAVHLENQSKTLQPSIAIFNSDKSLLQDWQAANAQGADFEVSFPAELGKEYFVVVASHNHWSEGKYRLSTR